MVPPDRRTGRGLKTITQSPVKLFAQDNNLIIHEAPPKTLQTWKIPKPRDLEAIHFDIDSFDIGVVVSFGLMSLNYCCVSYSDIVVQLQSNTLF